MVTDKTNGALDTPHKFSLRDIGVMFAAAITFASAVVGGVVWLYDNFETKEAASEFKTEIRIGITDLKTNQYETNRDIKTLLYNQRQMSRSKQEPTGNRQACTR
jgi:hypothetical protein